MLDGGSVRIPRNGIQSLGEDKTGFPQVAAVFSVGYVASRKLKTFLTVLNLRIYLGILIDLFILPTCGKASWKTPVFGYIERCCLLVVRKNTRDVPC